MSIARDSDIIESLAYFKRIGQPIIAAATALGGPVAILRISGNNLEKFQSFLGPFPKSGTFCYRSLPYQADNEEVLDKVLLLYFKNPHSFTGEDVIEIQLHGVVSLIEKIQNELEKIGAERALPGEFSFRAVHFGKMTLSEAEALQTALSTEGLSEKWASKLLSIGEKSEKVVEERFLSLLQSVRVARGRVEAAIDFPEAIEEQTKDFNDAEKLLLEAKSNISELLSSYYNFSKCSGEARIAIVGAPNAGKSTFLNALLGTERSLVSNIAGTTRDVVEARLKLNSGTWIRLADTAGIHSRLGDFPSSGLHSHFELERRGIDLGLDSAELATALVWVRKPGSDEDSLLIEKMRIFSRTKGIFEIYSHDDLLNEAERNLLNISKDKSFNFNKLTQSDRFKILGELERVLAVGASLAGDFNFDLVISRRQGHLLESVELEVERSLQCLKGSLPIELCAHHLREAETLLCRCRAQGMGEAYIEEIFRQFCLGK